MVIKSRSAISEDLASTHSGGIVVSNIDCLKWQSLACELTEKDSEKEVIIRCLGRRAYAKADMLISYTLDQYVILPSHRLSYCIGVRYIFALLGYKSPP